MQDSEQQTYVLQAPETCLEPPSQGYSLPMGAGQVERLLEPEQWRAGGACDRRAGLGQAPGSRGGPLSEKVPGSVPSSLRAEVQFSEALLGAQGGPGAAAPCSKQQGALSPTAH